MPYTYKNAIVHFKRLGSRVSHDPFNQHVLFFSKQCTYCKTNAIYVILYSLSTSLVLLCSLKTQDYVLLLSTFITEDF